MPRFAANLTMLFTELPLLERPAAAAEAGFEGVEILFPYDVAAPDLSRAITAAGLEMVLLNAPPPNWTGGPRGFAAIPGLQDRFRRDFERALRVAQALRARHMHVMSGRAEGPEARRVLIENLSWAVERAPHASLTIEPISPEGAAGYFLDDFDMAAEIIAELGAPNLGLQLDTFHAHHLCGDIPALWGRVGPMVRHIQIGGAPGRNEPDTGQVDHGAFFRMLDAAGYGGWVSAEYTPARQTRHGLGWLSAARG